MWTADHMGFIGAAAPGRKVEIYDPVTGRIVEQL
jgi:hypothetical protein